MMLTKNCMLTGRDHTMYIPMTPAAYQDSYDAWKGGMLIQNAFPTLDPEVREFIKTGITPKVWKETFGED